MQKTIVAISEDLYAVNYPVWLVKFSLQLSQIREFVSITTKRQWELLKHDKTVYIPFHSMVTVVWPLISDGLTEVAVTVAADE